jgi:hypothetical protein
MAKSFSKIKQGTMVLFELAYFWTYAKQLMKINKVFMLIYKFELTKIVSS